MRAYPADEGLSVYFRNINERKRAEAELRASEERFRFLADSIPVQVWTAGPEGELDYVSEQVTEYFGQPAAEVIGSGWQGLVDPEQMERVGRRWAHSLATGEPYEAQFRLRRHDGEYRWHLARGRAQLDPIGRVVAWYGSNTDIERQKEIEEAHVYRRWPASSSAATRSWTSSPTSPPTT